MFDDDLTMQKVRFAIGNDYAFFGYGSATEFENTITTVSEESKFDLLQYISETEYDRIAALIYASMDLADQYIFMAEVYGIASDVVQHEGNKERQNRKGHSDSLSVEGYSRSVSGISGKSQSAWSLKMKYMNYLQRAGVYTLRLERC